MKKVSFKSLEDKDIHDDIEPYDKREKGGGRPFLLPVPVKALAAHQRDHDPDKLEQAREKARIAEETAIESTTEKNLKK